MSLTVVGRSTSTSTTQPSSQCSSSSSSSISFLTAATSSSLSTCATMTAGNNYSLQEAKDFQKEIGVGSYSRCYLLRNGNVVKVLPLKPNSSCKQRLRSRSHVKEREHIAMLKNEVAIQSQLVHKNIVQSCGQTSDRQSMYIVMEHCSLGTLKELLHREKQQLPLYRTRKILADVLEGLIYLHTKQFVIHRDLKFANIFVAEDGTAKIGDFGFAVDTKKLSLLKMNNLRLMCGTPNYIAPEMIDGDAYGFSIDIWAFGVIMFCLLCGGRMPFEAADKDVNRTYENIRALRFHFTEQDLKEIPDSAVQLLNKIFIREPCFRPTLDDIAQSPFFSRRFES